MAIIAIHIFTQGAACSIATTGTCPIDPIDLKDQNVGTKCALSSRNRFLWSVIAIVVVVLFVLRPWQTVMVVSGRSVTLTTLFLCRLCPSKRLNSTSCANLRQ